MYVVFWRSVKYLAERAVSGPERPLLRAQRSQNAYLFGGSPRFVVANMCVYMYMYNRHITDKRKACVNTSLYRELSCIVYRS